MNRLISDITATSSLRGRPPGKGGHLIVVVVVQSSGTLPPGGNLLGDERMKDQQQLLQCKSLQSPWAVPRSNRLRLASVMAALTQQPNSR